MNNIQELCQDLRNGKMVILADDAARENEGDLVMAASLVTADHINFMATHARGLICLTLTDEHCQKIGLSLMVGHNTSSQGTNFTASIDAASGITTGISAADRARTILQAVQPHASADDIVQPGHIFPLRAEKGGVLTRAGHTEAGCDLTQLAGFYPAAVIVEIMNADGTMARHDDLIDFAKQHQLKIGYIADLIHYRLKHEHTVELVAQEMIDTSFGKFELRTYQDCERDQSHYALISGKIGDHPVPVRVHTNNPITDILHVDQGRWSRAAAQRYIGEHGGVLVLLEDDMNLDAALARRHEAYVPDTHKVGVGAQILRDIGVTKMLVLGSQTHYAAITGFDLEVVDYIEP